MPTWSFADGTLFDGSGGKSMVGDVAVKEDRIIAVGKFEAGQIGLELIAAASSSSRDLSTCTTTATRKLSIA